jgi:hypothetical protein
MGVCAVAQPENQICPYKSFLNVFGQQGIDQAITAQRRHADVERDLVARLRLGRDIYCLERLVALAEIAHTLTGGRAIGRS